MSWFSEYTQSLSAIQRGRVASLYFLYGSEHFLQDYAASVIEARFRQQAADAERVVINAGECSSADLEDALFSMSLFQTRKLIRILEVKELSLSLRKILKKYLSAPAPENCLICTASAIDKRNKFLADIENSAVILYCNAPFENEIPQWIISHVDASGKKISPDASAKLLEYCGSQMDELANELEKLILYVGDNPEIRIEDILAVSGFNRHYRPEDLQQALGKRDRKKAATILKTLVDQGTSDVFLVMNLYSLFWALRVLKGKIPAGQTMDGVCRSLGFYRKNDIDNLKAYLRNYNTDQLDRALEALVEADRYIKTSSMDTLSNLIVLIEKILETA